MANFIADYSIFKIALCVLAAIILSILKKAQVIALMLFTVGIGSLGFTIYDINTRQPVFEIAKAEEIVNLIGTVEEKNDLPFYTASYVVKTKINSASTRVMLIGANVHNVDIGDIITIKASLYQLRNTGIFPERSYNHSRGVLLKGDIIGDIEVAKGIKTPIDRIREYNTFIKSEISSAFPNDIGGLLSAVFLGDKSGLSPELTQNIRIAGIAHYTAVSGLHMTMLTHMFMLVLSLTPFRNNRRIKFIALVCAVIILAIFFNLTRSVIRAAIMLIICYSGELFMRKGSTLNSLGFALLLILIFEPYAALDVGLVMSFSGTFGVGVVAPAIIKKRKLNPIIESFIVSACASLCVLPASALYFGGISALSPITSVIILPFFTIAACAMVLYCLLVLFTGLGAVGQACLLAAGIMSKVMNMTIELLGQFTSAWISLDYWFMPYWIAFAIVAIVIVYLIYKSNAKTIKAACMTVATLSLMICIYNLNAVNSGRTYITIYSDSVSAWVSVKQSDTEAVIITADTPRAYEHLNKRTNTPMIMALLKSSRNNEKAFQDLSLQSMEYIPPNSQPAIYDISGKFTLDIHATREKETLFKSKNFNILFTRASNDNASPANVTIASGWVRNKREFHSDYVVYVSKSIPVEFEYERCSYYEPVYLLMEKE